MPFKSEKQKKFLFAKKPKLAKRWSEEYNKGAEVKKKPKVGYKTGKSVHSDKKLRPESKDTDVFAKQFYIKGKDGKFIPVPKKMINRRVVAKKGGKV